MILKYAVVRGILKYLKEKNKGETICSGLTRGFTGRHSTLELKTHALHRLIIAELLY